MGGQYPGGQPSTKRPATRTLDMFLLWRSHVSAAPRVLEEFGIRGMVREVAERAEVGKATAYGGHPAKEGPVATGPSICGTSVDTCETGTQELLSAIPGDVNPSRHLVFCDRCE
ncbi:hypothetical protein AQI94_29105 [Streptomyces pseudovenezuelae]|uniref:Uncharacterized protein n=1 Tax=Streptomyces pseudovenezuelae TaxID=67350 RepID=A0A124H9D3_9ACTN|nr:hypothetical protein AQI94_29105 [Streptomyces pseudovenezuelae]